MMNKRAMMNKRVMMNKIYSKLLNYFVAVLLLISFQAYSFKIDRVILASDNNPTYLEFWPIVAKAWTQIVGVRPTLALIAGSDVEVDESLGDVIRFEPIAGIPTSLQAQVIRWLLPIYFEDEVSLVSDIDMIPLCKDYFIKSVANVPEDVFVTYRASVDPGHYPMCYNAGMGRSFKKLFGINSIDDIPFIIKKWADLGWGWGTDERILYSTLQDKAKTGQKCINLGHPVNRRVDRADGLEYNAGALKRGDYIDAHLLRPYSKYKKQIDALAKAMNIKY